MTPNQAKVLKFIKQYWKKNDYSPSFKEIADGCKYTSNSSPYFLVHALEKRGYITTIPHAKRSIKLTEDGRNYGQQ